MKPTEDAADTPYKVGDTLDRDTAVNGAPDEEGSCRKNAGRSSAKPAEGGNDTPPPLDGSPEG
jgi:hypothetical protein